MASLTLTTRSPLDLEPTLFPNGIEPGSLIQVHGASGSGQTCLLTYLLARFVKCFPEKRAVLIDTRGTFSLINFAQVLSKILPELQITEPYDHPDNLTKVMPFLDRICCIKCHTPEDLLFCFGPKNAGMLERMLLTCSEFALVAVDSLDTFSYCSSLPNSNSSQQIDFGKLLKRSVEATKTPAICVMEDWSWKGSRNRENEEENNNLEFLKTFESSLETNVVVDKSHFTHSIFLQRLGIVEAEEAGLGQEAKEEEKNNETVYRAYLRSRNNPNIALSGASHRVKFSILSGMFKWLAPD